MISIDITKLRPGDVIFSLYPAPSSLAISALTMSMFSHAMLVVYPDVWFETDGAGSGFKRIENVKAYGNLTGHCEIIAELPYLKFDVLRLDNPPTTAQILASISNHIAFRYPELVEFLPLMIGLRRFPRLAEKLVGKLVKERPFDTGSYCSQLVFKILEETIKLPINSSNGHISPGSLRRTLYKENFITTVNCKVKNTPPVAKRNQKLEHNYENLLKVTGKLKAFQYPHNRQSFDEALTETFTKMGLSLEPSHFSISAKHLRTIITCAKYFRMHDLFWASRYN